MATFWPKHGPTGLNFDDFFDYFVFCVGSADEAEPCKSHRASLAQQAVLDHPHRRCLAVGELETIFCLY